jgi:surface protein
MNATINTTVQDVRVNLQPLIQDVRVNVSTVVYDVNATVVIGTGGTGPCADATAELFFDNELIDSIQIPSNATGGFSIDCNTPLDFAVRVESTQLSHQHTGTFKEDGQINGKPKYVKIGDTDRFISYNGTQWQLEKIGGGAHVHLAAPGNEQYPWEANWTDAYLTVTQATIGTYCSNGGNAFYVLKDSAGNVLETGSIAPGATKNITAPDATYNLDNSEGSTLFLGSIPSGDNETIIAPDGAVNNSDTTYTALVASGGVLALPDIDYTIVDENNVVLDTFTRPSLKNEIIDVTSFGLDGTVTLNGNPFLSVASGGSVDVTTVDQNNNPITPIVTGTELKIEIPDWVRPADWLPMPTVTSAQDTFVALHAVIEDSDNFCAFRFTTSAGQYEVDWGDGTVTLHNSNTNAEHQYNFTTYDTAGATLTTRGYKQAIITVTPVSGNLLSCSFQQRFVTVPAQNQAYSTGFLDCILSMPNASAGASIVFGGATVRHLYVERFDVKTIGACTSMANMFEFCSRLQSVPLFNTGNVTSMLNMFNACSSLQSVPLFNTGNVTNMSQCFQTCVSLQSVPLFNTGNVTSMVSMFQLCFSLQSVPLFNTGNVTNMQQCFQDCRSLQSVPLFNTANVTNMSNMFQTCVSLNSIPALSTASITPSAGTDFGGWNTNISLNRCQISFARQVNLTNGQLSQTALVEIFNNLVDRSSTTAANINITGNWGASALTVGERAIATGKNWTITG